MEESYPEVSTSEMKDTKNTSQNEIFTQKLSIFTMIMYSVPQFPVYSIATNIYVYLIPLYTNNYNWGIDSVGNLLSLLIVAMTIIQPIIGSIIGSSGENIEISKFKKYFICAIVMYGGTPLLYLVGFILLIYLPIILTKNLKWIIYLVSCAIGIGWGIYEIAFTAIGSNLSTNYDVRIDLQTWATSFYTFGIFFTHFMHAILGLILTGLKGMLNRHYILASLYFTILTISMLLFQIFVKTPEKDANENVFKEKVKGITVSDRPKLPLKDRLTLKFNELKSFLKEYYKIISNRNAVAMTLIATSNSIYCTMSGFTFCAVAKHFLEMPKFEAFAPLIKYFSMILILPIWLKIKNTFSPEKRTSLLCALVSETICIVLLLYTVKRHYLTWLIIILISYGFSQGILLTALQSMNGDVVDYGHAKNNKRDEGDLFGFMYFVKNGAATIALKLCFYFLEMYGYTGKEERGLSPSVDSHVKLNLFIVFGITYLFSYIGAAMYNIDRKYHRVIISDIFKHAENKDVTNNIGLTSNT